MLPILYIDHAYNTYIYYHQLDSPNSGLPSKMMDTASFEDMPSIPLLNFWNAQGIV